MRFERISTLLFVVITFVLHCECSSQNDTYSIEDIKKLQTKITNGDVIAYNEYKTYCEYKSKSPIDVLPYSLLMANKYSYPAAYYDISYFLISWYSSNEVKMDSILYSTILSYLERGCSARDYQCCQLLAIIYFVGDIYTTRDTLLAKEYAIQSSTYFHMEDPLSFWETLLAWERRSQIIGFPLNSTQYYAIKKE